MPRPARHGRWGDRRSAHSGLIREVRGRGLGVLLREAVLALAFDHLGARAAISSARVDNAASLGVSRRCGYTDNGVALTTSEQGPALLQHVRITLAQWQRSPRREVEVTGLEPCLQWFGATPRSPSPSGPPEH